MMRLAVPLALATSFACSTYAALVTPTFALKTISKDTRFDGLCVEPAVTETIPKNDVILGECWNLWFHGRWQQEGDRVVLYVPGPDRCYGSCYLNADSSSYGIADINWRPVTIEPLHEHGIFTYSPEKGFLASEGASFLACHWVHTGAAQLFVLSEDIEEKDLISTCGFVKLVKD